MAKKKPAVQATNLTCSTRDHHLVAYCAACYGRKGRSRLTPKKLAQLRSAAKASAVARSARKT
jgi:hypothetical protein